MKKFFVALCVVMALMFTVSASTLSSYEITKMRFGPFTYILSEPIPDIEKFKGNMQPVVATEDFAIVLWEGYDSTQDKLATIGVLFEKDPKEGFKGSIIFVQVSTGIMSGDPDKMKTVVFVDIGLIEKVEASYFLTRNDKFNEMEVFMERVKAKYVKKTQI